MSDSGTTSSLFIQGAGITINKDDNVGIINAGPNTILFNYMGNAFDLHDYQKKDLTQAVEGETTVEGALGALSTNKQPKTLGTSIVIDGESKTTVEDALNALKIKKYVASVYNPSDLNDALGSTDRDYCVTSYTYTSAASNKPLSGYGGQLMVYKQANFIQQISITKRNYNESPSIYIRVISRVDAESPWSFGSWQKLVTESDTDIIVACGKETISPAPTTLTTVKSIPTTIGSMYEVTFGAFWNNSVPMQVQIKFGNGAASNIVNRNDESLVCTTGLFASTGSNIELKAKWDSAGASDIYYVVRKVPFKS